MDNRQYNLVVGTVLLIAAFGFFVLPAAIRIDAFIPVILAIILLVIAIWFYIMGLSSKK